MDIGCIRIAREPGCGARKLEKVVQICSYCTVYTYVHTPHRQYKNKLTKSHSTVTVSFLRSLGLKIYALLHGCVALRITMVSPKTEIKQRRVRLVFIMAYLGFY